jgi:hypothetical protein
VSELLARVVPLALGAAFSPTVLAVELLILSAPKRALARAVSYVGGVLVILVGLTVIGLLVTNHGTGAGSAANPVTRAIDGTLGFVLLILALHTAVRALTTDRHRSPSADDEEHSSRFTSLPASFVFGIVMMSSNFSTILLYLPALREINAAPVGVDGQAVAVVVLFLIVVTPIVSPIVVRVIAPEPSSRWFASLHRFITRHQTQIAVAVEVIFGVYLLLKAVRG